MRKKIGTLGGNFQNLGQKKKMGGGGKKWLGLRIICYK